jgi:hypothetical protein
MMVYQLHGIFNIKLDVKVLIGEQRGMYEEAGVASVRALSQKHAIESKENQ